MNTYSFKLRIKAKTESLLTVGMGKPIQFGVDVPFYRIYEVDSNGNSFQKTIIPGSTIKGALRSSAIRVAWMLDLKAEPSIRPEEISRKIEDAVVNLFGGPSSEGRDESAKVIIHNATISSPKLIRRSRIRIDKKTLRVEERALFTEESLPINAIISFEIEAINLNEKEIDLLFLSLLEMMYNGIGRGGLLKIEEIKCLEGEIPDTEIVKLIKEGGLLG